MGGFGSGRWAGQIGRTSVEICRFLDVAMLKGRGCLNPGCIGQWSWSQRGEQVASVFVRAAQGHVNLSYCRHFDDGTARWIDERIFVVEVPCPFGGSRPLFVCPGDSLKDACARRAVRLYEQGGYIRCRRCHRLAYACQSEKAWERIMRRAGKIRIRLGGAAGIAFPFPDRPKGMWRRTYTRQRGVAQHFDELAQAAVAIQVDQIGKRLERLDRYR